jgi:hypothetical protein
MGTESLQGFAAAAARHHRRGIESDPTAWSYATTVHAPSCIMYHVSLPIAIASYFRWTSIDYEI